MRAKTFFVSVFFALAVLFLAAPAFTQMPAVKNIFCPVMSEYHARDKFYADYGGRRIYFCCRSCVKAFKKNPQKYLKNLRPGK